MTYKKLVHVDTLSCETILRKTPSGQLIIVAQCGGTKEPSKENRVYVFHSLNDGRTWTKKHLIMPDNGKAVYCTEVTVIENQIYAFLTLHNGNFLDFEFLVLKSIDDGYHWDITDDFPKMDGFCFVRGALSLSNGDLIFPYQQYLIRKKENNALVKADKYVWNADIDHCKCGVIIKRKIENDYIFGGFVNISLKKDKQKLWQWPEPTLAQLSDGRIVMLLRVNKTGYLFQSISSDLGMTWSAIEKTKLKNPGNKAKLIQIDPKTIALINTFNDGFTYNDRFPLSIWISDDDMNTWYYKKDLITFPGWLSYPDGQAVSKNKIQFAFEFNRHDIYFVEHIFN